MTDEKIRLKIPDLINECFERGLFSEEKKIRLTNIFNIKMDFKELKANRKEKETDLDFFIILSEKYHYSTDTIKHYIYDIKFIE